MNPAVLFKLFAFGGMKKYVAAALAMVVVTISLPVLVLFSMGGTMLSFLNGTVSSENAQMKGFYMGASVPGDTYAWGNCTYWVFAMRLWAKDPISTSWGNANTWDNRALADGYEVNHTPRVGAIMQTDAGEFGHVAYVTSVNPDTGTWVISEMNAPVFNVVSGRTFAASVAASYNFIQGKAEGKK